MNRRWSSGRCGWRAVLTVAVLVGVCGSGEFVVVGSADVITGSNETVSLPESIATPPAPDFVNNRQYAKWYRDLHFKPDWPHGEQVYASLSSSRDAEIFGGDSDLRKQFSLACTGPWSPEEMRNVAKMLQQHRDIMEAFEKACEVDDVQWFGQARNWHPVPAVLPRCTRLAAAMSLANAWRAGESASTADRLLIALRRIDRHAEHMCHAGGLVAYLYRSALLLQFRDATMRQAVYNDVVDASDMQEMVALLKDRSDGRYFAQALCCEWSSCLDLLQQLYPQGRFSDSAASRTVLAGNLPPGGVLLPSPEVTALGISEWFAAPLRTCQTPWSRRSWQSLQEEETRLESRLKGHSNLLLSHLLASSTRAYQCGMRCETSRRGTILLLAIHAYHAEHGRWPTALGQCHLDDPNLIIDPLSKAPFIYKIKDDQVWLYSVGLDGDDDKGTHDARWGETAVGGDFRFSPIP